MFYFCGSWDHVGLTDSILILVTISLENRTQILPHFSLSAFKLILSILFTKGCFGISTRLLGFGLSSYEILTLG